MCGYAVDWLRSCYRSQWHLFSDDPSVITEGRYYFADEDAPFYPGQHWLGARTWTDRNNAVESILGEDENAKQTWDNGAAPVQPPLRRLVGKRECIEQGDEDPRAPQPCEFIDGFPPACFVPTVAQATDWLRVSPLHLCETQRIYAGLIQNIYDENDTALTDFVSDWLGPDVLITTYPAVSPFPRLATLHLPGDFCVLLAEGTTNFQQLALQALYGLQPPTNFGIVGTSLLWYNASTYAISVLSSIGVTASTKLILTGHSYGGALACLVAARLRAVNANQEIGLLTFGCPKPGDVRVRQLLGAVDQTHLANVGDIVTILPPPIEELYQLAPVLGDVVFSYWPRWEALVEPVLLNEDGKRVFSYEQPMGYQSLLDTVSAAIAANPLDPIEPHYVYSYYDRLTRSCPAQKWPLCPPLGPELPPFSVLMEDGTPILGETSGTVLTELQPPGG